MKSAIRIPTMGESISEATIGRLLKATGSQVSENEEIVELETEKVNQVLYAPVGGMLEWSIQEGAKVAVGDVIGFIDTDKKAPEKKEKKPVIQEKKVEPAAAPSLRKGPEEFFEEQKMASYPPPPSYPKEEVVEKAVISERETRKKMSTIRKTIASRLVSSLHTTAMLTTFNEVDMSAIIDLRARHKESFIKKHGVKLGFMSFFVKSVVEGLKAFPALNASIDGEEIIYRNYFDIGIAVGTDKGLMVPVVRDADKLSFAQLEKAIETFGKKAREGKVRIQDLEGGSFTITNGGVYGSLLSTPILNPPQSGILGMHKIEKRAVVVEDQVVVRSMMYLALSYDHRIVDGKEAVSFLVRIKEILEDPSLILFESEV